MRLPCFLITRPDGTQGEYELLPARATFVRHIAHPYTARRRALLCCVIAFIVGAAVYIHFYGVKFFRTNIQYNTDNIPPTFDRFYQLERDYPQHDVTLPFPEGENGRFIWISNQHFGLGWNNVFQALYMNSHMAYLSNRAYVFEPYTWHKGPEPFIDYNGHLIPSRIPLAALVQGPIAGGPFPAEHPAPRSVSVEWFRKVCPENKRTRISIKEMNEGLENATVLEVMEKYVQKLASMTEGCLELYGGMEHPFDYYHFGDSSMETMWATLSTSPILRDMEWAPLVLAALRTNAADIASSLSQDPPPDLVPDLMAVHIRRGDYEVHCSNLANWSSSYMGWNQVPGLADRFVVPPGGNSGKNTPENIAEYMRHCWPTISQIANRVQAVRHAWEVQGADRQPIRRLYILTNGDRGWVAALKHQIMEDGDWDLVYSSRDMLLSFEQKYIAQSIDMAIAQRAAVFIGNGFSSLTANVVLMRRIRGLPLLSNHFW
ncbi:hypothetical protein DFH11DRAFT_1685277 [Phellopilus nigrolimitatus]|nr:hypothetical protein DFH11DRAFT_1685277 [Phellopilus nigrolimitatus]